jgi:hypothetical protein
VAALPRIPADLNFVIVKELLTPKEIKFKIQIASRHGHTTHTNLPSRARWLA